MTRIVLSDRERKTLLTHARELDQTAAAMRSRVAWSDENKHSKSAAEVIKMLGDPSTAKLFADRAQDLIVEAAFNEVEQCVWSLVNDLVTHPDELENIEFDHVYSVVRRAIRQATKGWEE